MNHYTNPTPLLIHLFAFIISPLDSFPSCSQIAHLFHQISVAHNIKDRYCIVIFVSMEGFISIAEWITDKLFFSLASMKSPMKFLFRSWILYHQANKNIPVWIFFCCRLQNPCTMLFFWTSRNGKQELEYYIWYMVENISH